MLKKLTKALFARVTSNGKASGAEKVTEPDTRTDGPPIPDDLLALDIDPEVSVVPRAEHGISRRQISPNALKVLYRLNDAGFQSFLVGGGVRDLLLGGDPKDFDVSTDATPEEIRDLFRNSRIIGRRFKIVHIRFGREIIEATTFRAHHQPEAAQATGGRSIRDLDSARSESGMILRDNVYGGINEDALRRDFTINALYYTTRGFVVLDFANGRRDLEQKQIRIIGDPETRYREDPVRLLRAIRFSAKLDFDIEEHTRQPLDDLADLLESVSPARLFDETLKLLANGRAERTFELLCQFRTGDYLFGTTLESIRGQDDPASRLVNLAMRNTDRRLQQGKSITPAFFYAALLWPPLLRELEALGVQGRPTQPVFHEAANTVVSRQLQQTAIPRRFTGMMREIWDLQWRLQANTRRRVEYAIAHTRFRAAYDFLLLREEAGEDLGGLGQWWTDFQDADHAGQETMLQALAPAKKPRRKRKKKRRKPSDGSDD